MFPPKNMNLKMALGAKGLSQRKAAFVCNVSESYLSAVMNGYKKPSRQLIQDLSLLTGKKPREIFPGYETNI